VFFQYLQGRRPRQLQMQQRSPRTQTRSGTCSRQFPMATRSRSRYSQYNKYGARRKKNITQSLMSVFKQPATQCLTPGIQQMVIAGLSALTPDFIRQGRHLTNIELGIQAMKVQKFVFDTVRAQKADWAPDEGVLCRVTNIFWRHSKHAMTNPKDNTKVWQYKSTKKFPLIDKDGNLLKNCYAMAATAYEPDDADMPPIPQEVIQARELEGLPTNGREPYMVPPVVKTFLSRMDPRFSRGMRAFGRPAHVPPPIDRRTVQALQRRHLSMTPEAPALDPLTGAPVTPAPAVINMVSSPRAVPIDLRNPPSNSVTRMDTEYSAFSDYCSLFDPGMEYLRKVLSEKSNARKINHAVACTDVVTTSSSEL